MPAAGEGSPVNQDVPLPPWAATTLKRARRIAAAIT